ncbi:malto-oligosyltrehalose trehalohydrolase [Piscinibacter sp. HJYY11]|uniref:malto-oligosyltrehalose trehalohydrolase n=1 Tax=Piscinibacter sp. HJYY11 TaxID=2801333 RepID=UPI0019200DB3|nr:malto-oligosyltrehalose trehalohydrolase [Piscinibacter sp. HJYY11]MBL0726653.1 malto-oligosyltrehalose trehalohydrolase [Piscinibacter sp. HJYY11]
MNSHRMPFGAAVRDDGRTDFRLWAPAAPQVTLVLGTDAKPTRIPLQAVRDGWHEALAVDAGPGTPYRFDTGHDLLVPDPASRHNPGDVHGASVVVDPRAYRWQDAGWRGRPWHEAVVYELHVGAFTPEGSFKAAAARLPELVQLGITAIELMPVADFPGRCGWGYDGVLPFAPDASYGTPDELKAFVDTAHRLGLMVLLDVVYNHFGPEGNYLHVYCPQFFNEAKRTPWGAAINFDGPHSEAVRDFFRHNALYWVEEFHFDGLRLDAVHAIHDSSPLPIAAEIAQAVRAFGNAAQRPVHVVFEHDGNRASLLERGSDGQPLFATAQWNDDLHHAAHVMLTGETDGYYGDYADGPVGRFARALAQGFIYQGQPSAHRGGVPHGEPSGHLPPGAFVSFLQNHDQVGNRAFGERITELADPVRLDAAYACLLLSPHAPMLFMGEEFAASTPFPYFCALGPELAQAVSEGRRNEFARFAAFANPAARERIPDPNAPATFESAKLRWPEREQGAHAERLATIRELLTLRREHLVPRLQAATAGGRYRFDGGLLHVSWPLGTGAQWHLVANLTDTEVAGTALPSGRVVHARHVGPEGRWPPGAVLVALEEVSPASEVRHG